MVFTLVVSAIAIAMVLSVRPGMGLGILVACTLLWPEYLRVPIGLAQMSAARFVAVVLVVRYAGRWTKLRRHPCDWFVVVGYLLSVLAVLAAAATSTLITGTIGSVFDTAMMYFAARLCLATIDDFRDMRWPIAITAFGVAGMAGFEALSHKYLFWSLYLSSGKESAEIGVGGGGVGELRWGMLRALVASHHPIYLGVAMTIVLSIVVALRGSFSRWGWALVVGAASLGVFFSLSSGAWIPALLLVAFLPLYRTTWIIKPILGFIALIFLLFELVSKRHAYYLISYIALDGANAWYRAKLMDVGIKYLPEYWLFGYGGRSFAHWGLEIDDRYFIDCVNNYILIAATSGVATMLLYVLAKIAAVWMVARSWKRLNRDQRWVAFVLVAAVVAVSLGEFSVSVFGAALLLNGVLLGCTASAGGWGSPRTAPVESAGTSPPASRTMRVDRRAASERRQGLRANR